MFNDGQRFLEPTCTKHRSKSINTNINNEIHIYGRNQQPHKHTQFATVLEHQEQVIHNSIANRIAICFVTIPNVNPRRYHVSLKSPRILC